MELPFIQIKVCLDDEEGTDVPIDHVVFHDGAIVVYLKEEKALPEIKKPPSYEPCRYEDRYSSEERKYIPICMVHNEPSKYVPEEGPNRPCLKVEPWGHRDEDYD